MSEFPGKQVSEMSLIEKLRNALQPKGTAPIVGLKPMGSGIWLQAEFVTECIDELEKMAARAYVGDEPNSLEKLAYMLLCDSAYIDMRGK